MTTILTGRFDEARVFGTDLHAGQWRKGTDIPYISHPLTRTRLLIAHGGSDVINMRRT